MGKVQRHQGANQADRWRKNARKRRRRLLPPQYLFALVMVPLAALVTISPGSLEAIAGVVPTGWLNGKATGASGTCNIKGNISINTGEHIYHVPGQEHYRETRISPLYGERWFCSEAEARAAGWRKARR